MGLSEYVCDNHLVIQDVEAEQLDVSASFPRTEFHS